MMRLKLRKSSKSTSNMSSLKNALTIIMTAWLCNLREIYSCEWDASHVEFGCSWKAPCYKKFLKFHLDPGISLLESRWRSLALRLNMQWIFLYPGTLQLSLGTRINLLTKKFNTLFYVTNEFFMCVRKNLQFVLCFYSLLSLSFSSSKCAIY